MRVSDGLGWVALGRVGLTGAMLLMLAAGTQAQAKKTYRDARFGVTLEYPAAWRVDAGAAFTPQPAILRAVAEGAQALLRVGFGPGDGAFAEYRKTTLLGAEFAAVVVEGGSAQTCRERLDISGFDSGTANENGVHYAWTMRTELSAGASTLQKVYAAFRQGRCYLYEEDIHEGTVPANEKIHALREQERNEVLHDLEAVMGSVRYAGSLLR